MQITAQKYGYSRVVRCSFDEALERTRKTLQQQGFGVQAEIDISTALHKKLGVNVPREVILGACNPQLAYQALQAEPVNSCRCAPTSATTALRPIIAMIPLSK